MYFPFFKLKRWGERSAVQPQTIYSAFPQGEGFLRHLHLIPSNRGIATPVCELVRDDQQSF